MLRKDLSSQFDIIPPGPTFYGLQMPVSVQNIDVNSPLIQYSGPWVLGGSDGDPETDKYNMGTFVFCASEPCSATIHFNGTEVHVRGAYRLNSSPFQVELDGETSEPLLTAIVSVEQFQVDLFNKTNMEPGPHSLTISNLPQSNTTHKNLNLDFFTWTTDIISPTDLHLQDDSSAFSYQPPTGWITGVTEANLPGFDGGTGHATIQGGATVTLTFTGDRVALYGAIGPQAGPYSVRIDDGSVSSFTAQGSTTPLAGYLANQMLFYADTLDPGNHTLTLTAKLTSPTQDVAIDYAVVDGTLNTAPSSVGIPTPSSSSAL